MPKPNQEFENALLKFLLSIPGSKYGKNIGPALADACNALGFTLMCLQLEGMSGTEIYAVEQKEAKP